MRIWIDTEFNSFEGELISLALVADDGREWYESLGCADPHPWVAENVMPVIGKPAMPRRLAQLSLSLWLEAYPSVHIVADWPEDIAHFCQFLITGPGTRIDTPPLTMEVRRDLDAVSKVPHNALEDARAMAQQGRQFVPAYVHGVDFGRNERMVTAEVSRVDGELQVGAVTEYRWVPVDPTPEMIAAGLCSWDSGMTPPGFDQEGALISNEYRAMVLAAPEVGA